LSDGHCHLSCHEIVQESGIEYFNDPRDESIETNIAEAYIIGTTTTNTVNDEVATYYYNNNTTDTVPSPSSLTMTHPAHNFFHITGVNDITIGPEINCVIIDPAVQIKVGRENQHIFSIEMKVVNNELLNLILIFSDGKQKTIYTKNKGLLSWIRKFLRRQKSED